MKREQENRVNGLRYLRKEKVNSSLKVIEIKTRFSILCRIDDNINKHKKNKANYKILGDS